jgi:hypothetical protein
MVRVAGNHPEMPWTAFTGARCQQAMRHADSRPWDSSRAAKRGTALSDDPQSDRIFDGQIAELGGMDAAIATVIQHAARHGRTMDETEAAQLIDEWRLRGLVRNISFHEYMDTAAE